MTYILHVCDLAADNIAFSYSAAETAMMALHVYAEPGHHPLHVGWTLRARRMLPSSVKDEIAVFGFLYGRPLATFWKPRPERTLVASFDDDLSWFLSQPIDSFVDEVRRTLAGSAPPAKVNPVWHETVRQLYDAPEQGRLRFADMLSSFWHTCLAPQWDQIEERLVEDIAQRGIKMAEYGIIGAFRGLAPEVSVDVEQDRVLLRRSSEADIRFGPDDPLFLMPSYFSWPHLLVQVRRPVTIVYPVMTMQAEGRQPVPPQTLLAGLRAIGDLTRMQLIQCLSQKRRSTQELAILLGLSEATISKHLKQLQRGGMVQSERTSYYVFYRLVDDPLRPLIRGLEDLLTIDPNLAKV